MPLSSPSAVSAIDARPGRGALAAAFSEAVDAVSEPVDANSEAVDANGEPVDANSEPVDANSEAVDAGAVDASDGRYYYLTNFRHVLHWVQRCYADILDATERDFLQAFPALPPPAQALFVRLVMRRRRIFRASTLDYAEVGCVQTAAQPLLELGWLHADPVLDLAQVFAVLPHARVRALLPDRGLPRGLGKAHSLQNLAKHYPAPLSWRHWDPEGREPLLALDPAVAACVERLRLMYFGNLRQDWSEFVLAHLGVFQYEPVAFDVNARAFQQRADVDGFLFLHERRERLEQGGASDETLRAMLDETLNETLNFQTPNPWLARRRAKLILTLGCQAERLRAWDIARRAYAACAHPDASYRHIRVLERSGRVDQAHAAALQATAAPHNEAQAQQLARALPRLQRALGLAVAARPRAARAPLMQLTLPRPNDGARVELLARAALTQPRAPVFYVENTLVCSLFGLLFWEAVFKPVQGAFFHPFQRGPADLFSPDFTATRRTVLDACMAQLDNGRYVATIRRHYATKAGRLSPFVAWGALDENLLNLALACIPAAHLKGWFTRLLGDIKANGSGLPDLIQFWPDEGRYALIEVKGPGDRLQDNQSRWMAYNQSQGVPVWVCQVRWAQAQA